MIPKRHWFIGLLIAVPLLLPSLAWAWDFAEHRKIGDRAMLLMPERLVEAGISPNEESVYALWDSLLNMHLQPDGKAFILEELSQHPNEVTYGTLCGLAGDHVENPLLLETGLQTHYSNTNRTFSLEYNAMNNFMTGAASMKQLSINLAYGVLAIKDLSHFYRYARA